MQLNPDHRPHPCPNCLLTHWGELSAEAAQRFKADDQHKMAGFYLRVMFGVESARDELAAAIAQGAKL